MVELPVFDLFSYSIVSHTALHKMWSQRNVLHVHVERDAFIIFMASKTRVDLLINIANLHEHDKAGHAEDDLTPNLQRCTKPCWAEGGEGRTPLTSMCT